MTKQPTNFPAGRTQPGIYDTHGEIFLGVAYYPDYWPRDRWETDLQLIQKAGFNAVRLAEYAWTRMEPSEGEFDFAWLDDVLDLCAKYEIYVILGTPTDAMPAWMARKYPETLAQKEDSTRIVWGGRKNNDYSSGAFRFFSRRIAQKMAERYKNHPRVIGWQIGNEFGPPESQSESQRKNFQEFLKKKYQTLDNLNEKWGTAFWSHTITDWDEIPIPLYWRFNPGMSLDWKHFHTSQIVSYQNEQIDVIRQQNPRQFITHNFIALHTVLNYPEVAKNLDFASWDNYPFTDSASFHYNAAMGADIIRGLKRQNFWIMEQATGIIGVMWQNHWEQCRNPNYGELRKIAFQQIAHGCDGMFWFRWRAAVTGREQYLGGLLGHDGQPNRKYHEIAKTNREIRSIFPALKGSILRPRIAVIFDYPSCWATGTMPVFKENNYIQRVMTYYKALVHAGVNADLIRPDDDFSQYRLLIAPNLVILPDEIAEKMRRFVENGGVFLADCRTGEKDAYNRIHERTLPGLLSPVLGIAIQEYSGLYKDMEYLIPQNMPFNNAFTAHQYVDWIEPNEAGTVLSYNHWQMQNYAALTKNTFGTGEAWYLGTIVKEHAFYDQLIYALLNRAGIHPAIPPVPGVEISVRENEHLQWVFAINHTPERKELKVSPGYKELLTGKDTGKIWELGQYDVAVIEINKQN